MRQCPTGERHLAGQWSVSQNRSKSPFSLPSAGTERGERSQAFKFHDCPSPLHLEMGVIEPFLAQLASSKNARRVKWLQHRADNRGGGLVNGPSTPCQRACPRLAVGSLAALGVGVTDCPTGRSGGRYGPDLLVCLCVVLPSEVNAPVMWCGLSHEHYNTITNY